MAQISAQLEPFKVKAVNHIVPDGLTLSEMLTHINCDPMLREHAFIWVGDQFVDRRNWDRVRPKPGVFLTIKVQPQGGIVGGGGGGGGGKNPLRTILLVGVIAASFYFGPMLGAALGGLSSVAAASTTMVFGSLSFASLGSAIISVAGMLLVNVIAPVRPPSVGALSGAGGSASQRDSPTLYIEGARNSTRPFGVVPVVLGVHRNVPPLGTQLFTEVVGENNYLRVLVVWGYGPLKIEDIKIAETPIEEFEDVEIITLEGRDSDGPLTLIPDTVSQDNFSILLTQDADWQTRVATPGADELSVDVTFPNGLVKFSGSGSRTDQTCAIQIQYREIGGSPLAPWSTPTFTAKTVPDDWVSGDTITFTHNRTGSVRHGFRWSPPTRGDYEIQIRRVTADTDDTTIFDLVQWTAIRSIVNESPIQFEFPVATTQLVIKATDQLNRIVDELNATTSSLVTTYQGSPVWGEAVSSNPADLFRHVLQGNANARRLPDARVDLDTLIEWNAFCAANGFEFNQIRDYQSSVWDTLADIASAGRASPVMVDGKWSVVYDYEQTVPVQHFTPKNSANFEAEKIFPDIPHGFRVRFSNRNEGWKNDERIVYADGYSAANATDFEGLDGLGITDPDHIWKHGRFALAQAQLRPERWTFNVDFEYLTARRGNLVSITHDVLLVGLKSGRIKSVITGGSPELVTGVTVDEVLTMESGVDYGMSIRTVGNVELTSQIVTDPGDQTTVTFSTGIALASAPSVGDLFGFGVLGSETIGGIVLSLEPASELSARVICIPESPAVYTSDTGTIPAFDSKITAVAGVPTAEILNVRSDESVIALGSGNTLIPRIAISVRSPGNDPDVVLDIQIRATGTGEPFYNADQVGRQGLDYLIGSVEETNSYDLRIRWRDVYDQRLPGSWAYEYNHRVVGQTSAPAALQNSTISVFGGNALIRWDRPAELDVRFGGYVRFRHSPETDPDMAVWSSSTSIGQAAKGDALFAALPLKPGTYLARVYDKSGRPSDVVALATKQASVLTFANVATITESPGFTGTHSNTVEDGGTIKLAGAGLFDDIPDFDALTDLDAYGGIVASGTYTFAAGLDLGTVTRVRLTSVIDATSVNTLDSMDSKTDPIDEWEDFDGTTQSAADLRVQVRTTDDDPAGSPVSWSAWNYLDSAEFQARGFQFRALLTTADPAYNIRGDTLGIVAEEI